jgi:hypothetical protein
MYYPPSGARGVESRRLTPDLFIVEYNAKFPPGIPFVMHYDPDYIWREDDYCGASPESWYQLLSDYRAS